MKLEFTKMQGCGNDYIYINCLNTNIENVEELSQKLSRRHFSVGADGIILICPSETALAKMRIFNADGSEGKMCGNGIRCVGKYLYDNGITNDTNITIETLSGLKQLNLSINKNGKCDFVSVEMGKADFNPAIIPLSTNMQMINEKVKIAENEWCLTALSVGNPHAVIFTDNIDSLPLAEIGPEFENNSLFPEKVNTEFVEVLKNGNLKMRVWERGSGETYACGTGACASVAAAVKNGLISSETETAVELKGGTLYITCKNDYSLIMRGPAVKVYKGVYEYD